MKLGAILCRATHDGRVTVESSDETWSTEGGNGKPLQDSCRENPMNSMKRQKDKTLEDEPPRSEGVQYVPWTARKSNQSILKEINPEYSLEGLMLKLKLKLQYFGHLMPRTDSMEKTLMLGRIEGRERRGQQKVTWVDGITDSVDMNLSKL